MTNLVTLIVALAVAQQPAATSQPQGDLGFPDLPPGTVVRVSTGREPITGTVQERRSANFLELKVAGQATPTYVRRSAIETITVVPERARAAAAARAVPAINPNRHVVYVHGICKHSPGFSNPWFAAMKPYTPQVGPSNVHEVVWSDLVNPPMAAGAAHAAAPQVTNDEQRRMAESIRAILNDRAERAEGGSGEVSSEPEPPAAAAGGAAAAPAPMAAAGGLFGDLADSIECVNDFVLYMTVTSTREQILERFDRVVRPRLENGEELEIISHSWGTVIAYEGLRRIEAQSPDSIRGVVHNLFTVGCALSIAPVRWNLAERFSGGSKPRCVNRWVNLDAEYDIVGGHIQGRWFDVDVEQLHLPPVGCTIPVTPPCAHGSYFRPQNVRVNRDIFGRFIDH